MRFLLIALFLIIVIYGDAHPISPYVSILLFILAFTYILSYRKISYQLVFTALSIVLFLGGQAVFFHDNEAFLIDFKYYLNIAAVMLVGILVIRENRNYQWFVFSSKIIIVTLFFYYMSFFVIGGHGASIYLPDEIPSFMSHRVFGPSLLLPLLLSFQFGDERWKYLFLLLVASAFKGAGQEFIFSLATLWIALFYKSKKISYTVGLLCVIFIIAFIYKVGVEIIEIKLLSFQTRINDLRYVLSDFSWHELQTWFGEGIGVKTEVVRVNPFVSGISETRDFLEIDNGFYYLFHRFGMVGLLSFIISYTYIFFNATSHMRFFLSIGLITMLMSITVITSTSNFLLFFLAATGGIKYEN